MMKKFSVFLELQNPQTLDIPILILEQCPLLVLSTAGVIHLLFSYGLILRNGVDLFSHFNYIGLSSMTGNLGLEIPSMLFG